MIPELRDCHRGFYPQKGDRAMRRDLALTLLIIGALLTLGARWAERPIASVENIVGEWRGTGTTAGGQFYFLTLVFKKDGSLDYSQIFKGRNEQSSQRPPGTVRQAGRKLAYKDSQGLQWTVTLYEDKKRKRLLEGHGKDGSQWKVKQKRAEVPSSPSTSKTASTPTSVSTSTSLSKSSKPACLQDGQGTATLSWIAPTTNTDGSPVTLGEYRVYCGSADSTSAMRLIDTVKFPATTAVIKNLSPGKYFFAVIAISKNGVPSDFSNVASKKID
jgi:hypothetical protein